MSLEDQDASSPRLAPAQQCRDRPLGLLPNRLLGRLFRSTTLEKWIKWEEADLVLQGPHWVGQCWGGMAGWPRAGWWVPPLRAGKGNLDQRGRWGALGKGPVAAFWRTQGDPKASWAKGQATRRRLDADREAGRPVRWWEWGRKEGK